MHGVAHREKAAGDCSRGLQQGVTSQERLWPVVACVGPSANLPHGSSPQPNKHPPTHPPPPLRPRRCVAEFDHHCPVVGNCVGAGNRREFCGYLVLLWGAEALWLRLAVHFWKR